MGYIEEIKKLGLTGDQETDEIMVTSKPLAVQQAYAKIMQQAGKTTKANDYDAKMQQLQKERKCCMFPKVFDAQHPELAKWERRQAEQKAQQAEADKKRYGDYHFNPEKGDSGDVEVMSDEEIIRLAKQNF